MRIFLPSLLVALIVAPFVVACGGRILQETDDPNAGTGADSAAPGSTSATTTTTWPACPSDSAPVPVPADVDRTIVDLCTRVCDRGFACEKCSWASCVPSCIADATKADCGATAIAEDQCLLDHVDEAACGAPPSCAKTYCEYANCGVQPAYQSTCP